MRKKESINNCSNCLQSSILTAVARFRLRLDMTKVGVEVSHEEIWSRGHLIVST